MTNFVGFCFMKEGEEQGNPFVLDMLSVRVKIISIQSIIWIVNKKKLERVSLKLFVNDHLILSFVCLDESKRDYGISVDQK